ncbi:MAG: D-aminoacyl-tRNA deacylase [Caldisphaera sp.]|nr:D-aminoacyl-tRNA deacylase [Caldisphaera sp.]
MIAPKISIVFSVDDKVGSNVVNLLIKDNLNDLSFSFCEKAINCYKIKNILIAGFNEETINFDFLDSTPDKTAEAIIVISKHQSTSNVKALTLHHTGNPSNENPYGGNQKELSFVMPLLTKTLFKLYKENAKDLSDYEFTLEATHHGPTSVKKPLTFIEIGSTESEWNDTNAVSALTKTIENFLNLKEIIDCDPAIGIGSNHYPKKFSQIELNENYCFGHIISKYYVDFIDYNIIKQMIEKSIPNPKVAFIEKKGIRSEKRKEIEKILNNFGLEIMYV